MSRIGNAHITIPAGVTVDIKTNNISVKGPKGTLSMDIDSVITASVEGNTLKFTRSNELDTTKAKHGLYRALTANMVKGVTEGFKKSLTINGVGWKVAKQGNKVVMSLGLSHTVEIFENADIKLECPSQNEIVVSGIDKDIVGEYAAKVRSLRKPEPYHGYGIKYTDEVIERKVGKTAGAKA